MLLRDELIGIERRLWSNHPEFYAEEYLADATLVFDGIGKISRDQAVDAIREEKASGRFWAEVTFDDLLLSQLAEDVALLTYRVTARWNHEQKPSSHLCTTIYVRKDGAWRVTLHQQTSV